jgi:hypothetical protein
VKLLFAFLGLPLAVVAMMSAATASDLSPTERYAIIQTATQAALTELKLPPGALQLVPERLKHSGAWVFLQAKMRNSAGRPFDYSGTDLYEMAQAGGKSDLCAALLRREGSSWRLIEIAVGPTDVAWEDWPARHNAPASLFAMDVQTSTTIGVPAALQGRWEPISNALVSAGPVTLGEQTLRWSICGNAVLPIEPQFGGQQQVLVTLDAAGAVCRLSGLPVSHLSLKPGNKACEMEVTLYQNAQQLNQQEPGACSRTKTARRGDTGTDATINAQTRSGQSIGEIMAIWMAHVSMLSIRLSLELLPSVGLVRGDRVVF